MSKQDTIEQSRRKMLIGAGAAIGASATAGLARAAGKPAAATADVWHHEADVVCVGSGAAACAAAVTAIGAGASVIVVEKMPLAGGTTAKSGGVAWIPNHPLLRAKGIVDAKADCLRYMARYAYPQIYDATSPTLGLPEPAYRLLEAFYDNGSKMVERFDALGAVRFQEFNLWFVNKPAPDYADHLPENKLPKGRCLEPSSGAGPSAGGGSLARQMEQWLRGRNVPILLEHRVTRVVKDGPRVIGIEAETPKGTVRIKARRGVIFGSGGYAHNTELVGLHQTSLVGSCAMPGSTGDFIGIAAEAGARMGTLSTAWRSQVLLEEALENRAVGLGTFVLPGDSMFVVNKYGKRVVNEARNYNDRTTAHFIYDPVREEYPNQVLFMIFDERSLEGFGGAFPYPADRREARFLIQGGSFNELTANIAARLDKIAAKTGGVRLAPDFAAMLKTTVARYNGYAETGHDLEFERGLHDYDRDWHLLFSAMKKGTSYPPNPRANFTMHPLTPKGPYYAYLLGAGALDTSGGPAINEKAQVLDSHDRPIPGLYGAGNCIASPTRGAYFGAGGTIGPALTYGYIAANNALADGA